MVAYGRGNPAACFGSHRRQREHHGGRCGCASRDVPTRRRRCCLHGRRGAAGTIIPREIRAPARRGVRSPFSVTAERTPAAPIGGDPNHAYGDRRRLHPWHGDKWPLDAVFIMIDGVPRDLRRAVVQGGNALEIVVQRRRDRHAAHCAAWVSLTRTLERCAERLARCYAWQMRAYSEDLRARIVRAVENGMSKAAAALRGGAEHR